MCVFIDFIFIRKLNYYLLSSINACPFVILTSCLRTLMPESKDIFLMSRSLRLRDSFQARESTRVKRTSCYRSANTLLQISSQVVSKLCSHCLSVVPMLQQVWIKLLTTCSKFDGINRLVSGLIQP